MYDSFNREINYLRVSVTDRCNLRCTYCMPEEGIRLLKQHEILSYEEILEVIETAVSFGFTKIRITGGEPLVRKGIIGFIEKVAAIQGIADLSMTSNGILLEDFAQSLKNAGLQRINVSLDSINPLRYKEITRGGNLDKVLRGIFKAAEVGLHPIKINCVVKESSDEEDAQQVAEFARINGFQVRFIHQMVLKEGHFSVVEGGTGGDCEHCNRLRLSAKGLIIPCLFSNLGFDIRKLGIREALLKAIEQKPCKGTVNTQNLFSNIGG